MRTNAPELRRNGCTLMLWVKAPAREELLLMRWSPDEIAGLLSENYESFFLKIYGDKVYDRSSRKNLLRQKKKLYNSCHCGIHDRHWCQPLVSHLGRVDHKSKYAVIVKALNKTYNMVILKFIEALNVLNTRDRP